VVIQAGSVAGGPPVPDHQWTFNTYGNLILPNSAAISQAADIEITAAATVYTDSLTFWAGVRASYQAQADNLGITSSGWPFIAWNVTGPTATDFQQQLTAAWSRQQAAPSSPPLPLIFVPPMTAATYSELRSTITGVKTAWDTWQALRTSVEITSGSESITLLSNGKVVVPNIIQTDPEEDLVIRTRYASATSPPGTPNYNNRDFTFGTNGSLKFPDTTVQTTAYAPVSGSWTVTTGTNTYSFILPGPGTYTMWVNGNIANGIIIWNATVSLSNNNVPVIGTQYAWNYTGGGSPILLTAIPTQIRGTAGTISTDNTYVGTTSNRFDFGISNTSGASRTINYGYTKI
jgi:hypothetical protein